VTTISDVASHRPPLDIEGTADYLGISAQIPKRKLLDLDQAAEYLNVTTRFMRDRRSDRSIPAIKLGGLLRFDPDDLDEYREACRKASRSETECLRNQVFFA
jgi:excisionase family DNA binding protein